jgi:glycosyltransferase involved in cell wall biosynthesis
VKILAFSHTGLTTGGAEQCLIEYVDLLTKRGHECKVIIPHEGEMQKLLTRKKIQNRVIGYGWATRPHKKVNAHAVLASTGHSLAKIFHEVEKTKPDVILVNTVVIPWGLYAGRLFGIPTVLLVHEIISDKDPSLNVMPTYEDYVDILNNNTDVIIYNSDFVKNEYKKDIIKPFEPKEILYPLPPLDKKLIDKLYRENEIGVTLKIAIFGAISPRKNQLETLEAIKILKDQGKDKIRVDLYGDAVANVQYVGLIKKYIKDNSLGDIIKIKGYTTSVYETMNEYNIVISNSSYEPFGRTIVEAQLFGRIVIANNTGGSVELVSHGETGLLYSLGKPEDLARQIEWVLAHKNKALSLGRAAKNIQKKKYLTNTRYEALFKSIDNIGDLIKDNSHKEDIFNPTRSLYEYNHALNERYKKIERLINNRVTRTAKNTLKRAQSKAKIIIKDILVKM